MSFATRQAVVASASLECVVSRRPHSLFAPESPWRISLLADLIHNFGDALTAVPLGIAFVLRSVRGERWAGFAVVLAIFVSACAALY